MASSERLGDPRREEASRLLRELQEAAASFRELIPPAKELSPGDPPVAPQVIDMASLQEHDRRQGRYREAYRAWREFMGAPVQDPW